MFGKSTESSDSSLPRSLSLAKSPRIVMAIKNDWTENRRERISFVPCGTSSPFTHEGKKVKSQKLWCVLGLFYFHSACTQACLFFVCFSCPACSHSCLSGFQPRTVCRDLRNQHIGYICRPETRKLTPDLIPSQFAVRDPQCDTLLASGAGPCPITHY